MAAGSGTHSEFCLKIHGITGKGTAFVNDRKFSYSNGEVVGRTVETEAGNVLHAAVCCDINIALIVRQCTHCRAQEEEACQEKSQ